MVANTIQREQFRPSAGPVNMQKGAPTPPAPVAAPSQTNGLMQLGEALSGISQSISPLIQRYGQERQAEAHSSFANQMASMTPDEARDFRDRERPGMSDLERNALDGQFGIVMANARRRQIEHDITSGRLNLVHDNIEDTISSIMEEDMEAYDSPQFRAAYNEIALPAVERLRSMAGEAQSENFGQEVRQNLYSILQQSATDVFNEGGTDAQAEQILREVASHHGPGTAFNLRHQDIDEVFMDVIEDLARGGHKGLVNNLLDNPRGEGAGPLSGIRRHRDRSAQIREVASRAYNNNLMEQVQGHDLDIRTSAYQGELPDELFDEQDFRDTLTSMGYTPAQQVALRRTNATARESRNREELQVLDAEESSLIQRGYVDQIQTLLQSNEVWAVEALEAQTSAGTAVTMARDPAVQEAIANEFERIERSRTATMGESPETAERILRDKVELIHNNGVVHEPWRRLLSQGARSARLGGDNLNATVNGLALYQVMNDLSPSTASRMAGSEEASEFYANTLTLAREMYEGDHEAAVNHMTVQMENPDFERFNNRWDRGELDDALDSIIDQSPWWRAFRTLDTENVTSQGGYVNSTLRRRAMNYVGIGEDTETAIELAAKSMEQDHKIVRGTLIPTRNVHVPDNFEAILDFAAGTLVGQHSDSEFMDEADIVLTPHPNNQNYWIFRNRNSLSPLVSEAEPMRFQVGPGEEDYVTVPMNVITPAHLQALELGRQWQLMLDLQETNDANQAREAARNTVPQGALDAAAAVSNNTERANPPTPEPVESVPSTVPEIRPNQPETAPVTPDIRADQSATGPSELATATGHWAAGGRPLTRRGEAEALSVYRDAVNMSDPDDILDELDSMSAVQLRAMKAQADQFPRDSAEYRLFMEILESEIERRE